MTALEKLKIKLQEAQSKRVRLTNAEIDAFIKAYKLNNEDNIRNNYLCLFIRYTLNLYNINSNVIVNIGLTNTYLKKYKAKWNRGYNIGELNIIENHMIIPVLDNKELEEKYLYSDNEFEKKHYQLRLKLLRGLKEYNKRKPK